MFFFVVTFFKQQLITIKYFLKEVVKQHSIGG